MQEIQENKMEENKMEENKMEENKEMPLIPTYISHIAINYSIPNIYFASIITFYKQHIILSYILYFLYLTSNLFWNCIYSNGFARNIDIFAVITTLLYGTFITCNYIQPYYRTVWYNSVKISVSAYVINQTIFYIGRNILQDKNAIEYLMYYVVFIHMIFLHYLPTYTCIYCILYG